MLHPPVEGLIDTVLELVRLDDGVKLPVETVPEVEGEIAVGVVVLDTGDREEL
jgi:hypothetical protein